MLRAFLTSELDAGEFPASRFVRSASFFPGGLDADVQGVANRMLTVFCGGFKLCMQSVAD